MKQDWKATQNIKLTFWWLMTLWWLSDDFLMMFKIRHRLILMTIITLWWLLCLSNDSQMTLRWLSDAQNSKTLTLDIVNRLTVSPSMRADCQGNDEYIPASTEPSHQKGYDDSYNFLMTLVNLRWIWWLYDDSDDSKL